MPAGGGATNLATSLDLRTTTTIPSSLVAKNTGRFNNVLIGQAIAMTFNVNIPGNNLPDSKSFGEFDLRGLECKTTIVTLEPSSNSTCAVPFAGTVGNDTLISLVEGPRISIHLYLPIKYEGVVKNIIIVRHRDVRRMKEIL